jgi:hypothetical protein
VDEEIEVKLPAHRFSVRPARLPTWAGATETRPRSGGPLAWPPLPQGSADQPIALGCRVDASL